MPMVSIVLPTHNGDGYLRQSIQSCLDQTYGDFELIIVDDCSKDATPKIADEYAARDTRVKVLHLNPNRKLPGALNAGFKASAGKYLSWTSDDNMYRPEAIHAMVEYLDAHPDIAMVYADYTGIDEAGNFKQYLPALEPGELAYHGGAVGACFLYRREVAAAVGEYDEQLFCAEDYDYFIRMACKFPIAPLHKDLYIYRYHSKSLTATQKTRVDRGSEAILVKHLPNMAWAGRLNRGRGYLRASTYAYHRGAVGFAAIHLFKSLCLSPGFTIPNLSGRVFNRIRRTFQKAAPEGAQS